MEEEIEIRSCIEILVNDVEWHQNLHNWSVYVLQLIKN